MQPTEQKAKNIFILTSFTLFFIGIAIIFPDAVFGGLIFGGLTFTALLITIFD